jgi:hypothetical protein
VTAVAPGSSVISAAFGGQTGQLPVQVVAVDNVQVVSITLNRVIVDGTCDTDSLFESAHDGEFSFRFEVERSGGGRTPVWTTDKQAFNLGTHSLGDSRFLRFNRNVSKGEDFVLWFTATEWDGALGADSKLNAVTAKQAYTYQGGKWVGNAVAMSVGSDRCGATIQWTFLASQQ